jgi:hypothetical protein
VSGTGKARSAPKSTSSRVILAPVREDGSPSGLREALAAGRRELVLYLSAVVVYVSIGVAFPEFLFTWIVSTGFLLVFVVILPALVRRLRS